MRFLLVSLFLPHPQAGHAGGRYVFELLRHLAERHQVDLATRLEVGEEGLLDELRPLCRTIHPFPYRRGAGLAGTLRLGLNYLVFSRFADRLIAAGNYDLVQVEWVEAALLIRRHPLPMVLDAHDVLTKPAERRFRQARGVRRLFAGLAWLVIGWLERRIGRRFTAVFTLSEYDRDYLRQRVPGARVEAVPIPAGMDLTDREFPRQPGTILFLASYRYRPTNVQAALWFYREVFPLVRQQVPAARFVIAGDGPPAELAALAADSAVTITGFVEDLDRCHKEAAIFVAPILTGGGIIVKVLDALAAGTPTVTTSYGNEGVGAIAGRDLLVADDPAGFAAAVVRLLTDREFADRLGASGREHVRRHFGREALFARFDRVIADLAGKRSFPCG